jgi:hypothetical protein
VSANSGQNLANHPSIDKPYLGSLLLLLGHVLWRAWQIWLNPSLGTILELIFAAALVVVAAKIRLYSLRVQDRVIRMEERTRMQAILPAELYRDAMARLTESQYVALRFASDQELEARTREALGGADLKTIKANITNWRGDYFRV